MTGFGLGAPTGLDLPLEKGGLYPSREWKQKQFARRADQVWFPGETVITTEELKSWIRSGRIITSDRPLPDSRLERT